MPDLILRPSTLVEGKPWALQLRYHDSCGPTDYHTITGVSEETARAIAEAGAPYYLFGDPPAAPERKFSLGQRVTKIKGSSWQGRVVGFYTTTMTPIGYAVESEREPGSVQIYPESALVAAPKPDTATS
jgi:hypothetical protein